MTTTTTVSAPYPYTPAQLVAAIVHQQRRRFSFTPAILLDTHVTDMQRRGIDIGTWTPTGEMMFRSRLRVKAA